MAEQEILYDKENGLGIITFNRPEKMNAITDDMLVDLTNIINDSILDSEVRAVIITGNGRAFCGGTDVTSGLARDQSKAAEEREKKLKKVNLPESPLPGWTFTRIPKPTIAAVNGAAVGMGAEWTAQLSHILSLICKPRLFSCWIKNAPNEYYAIGRYIPDKEDEGSVNHDFYWLSWCC